ncbi:MAG: hypothetical protein ACD_22C00237G0016 [uncultured bacterium]|nr:MAG: hypothetical protein ACD_22C00237G0016 [uncultured bacterium]
MKRLVSFLLLIAVLNPIRIPLVGFEMHESWPLNGQLLCIVNPDASWAGLSVATAYCTQSRPICGTFIVGEETGALCLPRAFLP